VSSAGRPALVFRGRRTGYAELADRVDRLASALQGEGIERGHRVAYLGDNHPSFIEALFASALTGAIFVPLNTRLSAPELSYMLSDSGARLLIVTERLFSQAEAAVAGAPVRMIEVSDQETPGRDDYQAFLATGGTWRQPSPAVTLDDPALIVYTSGTTGRPKGAVLSHGNLTWNAVNVLADYDILSTDRSLMISPLFHVASLGMGCLPILLKGATVLLEERFSPAGALRSVEQFHATALSGVPTTFLRRVSGTGPGARRLRRARALVQRRLRHDRGRSGHHHASSVVLGRAEGLLGDRALLHRVPAAGRRRASSPPRCARRDRDPRAQCVPRLLEQPRSLG